MGSGGHPDAPQDLAERGAGPQRGRVGGEELVAEGVDHVVGVSLGPAGLAQRPEDPALVVEPQMRVVEQADVGHVPPAEQELDPDVHVGGVGDADDQPGTAPGRVEPVGGPQQRARVDQVLDDVEQQDGGERPVAEHALERRDQLVLVGPQVDRVPLEPPPRQLGQRVPVDVEPDVVEAEVPDRLGERTGGAAQVEDHPGGGAGALEQPVTVAVRAHLTELPRVLLHVPFPPNSGSQRNP